jgi:ribose transport system ATP-binding protein
VVVSHRLHEVVENCHQVTLLKDGRVEYGGDTPEPHALHAMFATASGVQGAHHTSDAGTARARVLLEATLASADHVRPFDITVRGGEVVGLVGSLASALFDAAYLLAGRRELASGTVTWGRRDGNGSHRGTVAFLAEDRQRMGNLTGLRVGDNLSIGALRRFSVGGWINRGRERAALADAISELSVVPPRQDALIGGLSGGNQQKVLFGRAMLADPDVYVLCEPTRGVDVQTRLLIYGFIRQMAANGAAVVVATVDVDDAMAVSDRIAFVAGETVEPPVPAKQIEVDALLARLS